MSEKKKVTFKTHSGEPLTVDVVGADGKAYEMQITLAVFAIYDTGEKLPAPPPAVGMVPQFEVQAQVATLTRTKAS